MSEKTEKDRQKVLQSRSAEVEELRRAIEIAIEARGQLVKEELQKYPAFHPIVTKSMIRARMKELMKEEKP